MSCKNYDEAKAAVLGLMPEMGTTYRWTYSHDFLGSKVRSDFVVWVVGSHFKAFNRRGVYVTLRSEKKQFRGAYTGQLTDLLDLHLLEFWHCLSIGELRFVA